MVGPGRALTLVAPLRRAAGLRPFLPRALFLAVVALLSSSGCRSSATSILLRVDAEEGFPRPDELRLSIYSGRGVEVSGRRVPEEGSPTLPGEVLLQPSSAAAGRLRVHLQAVTVGSVVGEGAVVVETRDGEQVEARLTLSQGRLSDADGDGVPDVVDSCPVWPNPDQGACGADDDGGGADGSVDGAPAGDAGGGADTWPAPDTVDCDEDRDKHRSRLCGGLDCDDENPAVHPGQAEGPLGTATCADGLDNDCDGQKDDKDTGCWSCQQDGDCADGNPCTADSCVGGACQNPPANPGKACNDGLYCTVNDVCLSGVCGGAPRDCGGAAPACQAGSCDEAKQACVYKPVPDGSSCDDANPCTQGEACSAGACKPPGPVSEAIELVNVSFGTDRATRIDAQGKLHTAYYDKLGKRLRYATNASGSWKAETVDSSSSDVGQWPAVALDAKGQPHIAYLDAASGTLKHAVKSSGWSLSTIAGGAAGHTSIDVDKSGKFHISFLRQGTLWYATGKPQSWTLDQVDKTPGTGLMTSLAVDAAGRAHIAHGEGTPPFGATKLRYTTNSPAGVWTSQTPAPLAKAHGSFPSIAVAPSGDVHISHYPEEAGPLYLTSRVKGAWKTESPDPTGDVGSFSTIELDSKEHAHIAYRGITNKELRYATNAGGAWKVQILYATGNSGRWASMTRAPSGTIHIIFEDDNVPQLRHFAFSACP